MKEYIGKSFIFLTGIAVGAAISWKYAETKYKKIAEEEIESVKETFENRLKNVKRLEDVAKSVIDISEKEKQQKEVDLKEYTDIIKHAEYGQTDQADISKAVKEGKIMADRPYIISPEEFGENPYYDTISLTYYSDKVLTDEDDIEIEDVDGLIGEDSLNHFGEYEDDSVFVRNDELQTDYEILLDERAYYDINHQMED